MAPRRSSAVWVVVAVKPESGVVLLALPVLVLSNVPDLARPENSSAVSTRLEVVEGNVTVMVFAAARAFTLWAERMTVPTEPDLTPALSAGQVFPAEPVALKPVVPRSALKKLRVMLLPCDTATP